MSDDGLRLADAAWLNENAPRQVELLARAVARRKPPGASKQGPAGSSESSPIQEHDPATLVMDTRGLIALWSPGASLLYGYSAKEAIGKTAAFVYPKEDSRDDALRGELDRAATSGHYSGEGWHVKKDGSRFWANAVTLAVREAGGELRGYARIVRDFSERHIQSEKLRTSRIRPTAATSTISGVVTGEFEQVHEASDVFLDLLGYERADLAAGLLRWPDLAAPEYEAALDLAHEEGLRFGACTPYEVELVRKDGTHVPALVVSAVLQLSPFRWIAFVQDLQDRDRYEVVPESSGDSKQGFEDMVGNSSALARVVRQVEVVAPTDANVLIVGETGTGKELVARAVHRLSPRRNFPFVTLNCAAIPTGLLESELFGYEKGAFTGALSQKLGRFEMAHRGTLFLDEVGDIPLELQPKLLRALQEKSFERLGGTKTIPIDVRLVAATNRNLTQMMGDKLFRADLYYRLKVFPISTPPLRDHPEDIPILIRHFMSKYSRKMNKRVERIPPLAMREFEAWPWPGNVRELENFIERSVILSPGTTLRAPLAELRADGTSTGADTLVRVERDHILRVLRETGGVISKAATRLGIPRTTLNAMMQRLSVSRKDL